MILAVSDKDFPKDCANDSETPLESVGPRVLLTTVVINSDTLNASLSVNVIPLDNVID